MAQETSIGNKTAFEQYLARKYSRMIHNGQYYRVDGESSEEEKHIERRILLALEESRERNGWIRTSERMPTDEEMGTGKPVLGWDGKYRGYCLLWANHMFETWSVKFWQPLPAEPTKPLDREGE